MQWTGTVGLEKVGSAFKLMLPHVKYLKGISLSALKSRGLAVVERKQILHCPGIMKVRFHFDVTEPKKWLPVAPVKSIGRTCQLFAGIVLNFESFKILSVYAIVYTFPYMLLP